MTPPVGENETLYRQVGQGGQPVFYDAARTPLLHNRLFLPNDHDTDGLSVIRAAYRSEIWACHRLEKEDVRYRLACLTTDGLAEIFGFTYAISADSIDRIHGEPIAHCVICEINISDYKSDGTKKARMKEWAEAISNRIQSQHILGPSQRKPNDSDPIRPQPHL